MKKQVVLVTGGSSGIGQAVCLQLHQQGHIVYGTSRNPERHSHLPYHMLHLDLHDTATIAAAVDKLLAREQRIDVLVNNAGIGMAGAVEDVSQDELIQAFQLNVFGVVASCQWVIPTMRAQCSGKIITVSSIAGEFGLPYRGIYSATKSALDRISETLRMELSPWNIDVSYIQPGDFKTGINANRLVAAAGLDATSAYYHSFKKQYKRISEDVSRAHDPKLVAITVARIMRTERPRMRYPVATFYQRLSLSLNRVLPSHLFQKLLVKRYPVN